MKTNPQTGRIALWIPDTDDTLDVSNRNFFRVQAEATALVDTSPCFFVKCGVDLVDEDEPICKLVAFVDFSRKRWSLQLSMSHMIADGYTFYSIYGMLDKDARAFAMEVERISFNPAMLITAGPMHGKMMSLAISAIVHKLRFRAETCMASCQGRPPVLQVRYVLESWLQERKAEFLAEPDAPFISANDILTSWFFSVTKPACGAAILNMRDRFFGLEAKHAGCYGALMIYYPQEYQNAANIRRSVWRKSPACMVDGCRQRPGAGWQCGMVSAWHSFSRTPNFDGCEQLVHLPTGASVQSHHSRPSLQVPTAVIFRPKEDRLAMLTITAEELPEGPLGDVVPFSTDGCEL